MTLALSRPQLTPLCALFSLTLTLSACGGEELPTLTPRAGVLSPNEGGSLVEGGAFNEGGHGEAGAQLGGVQLGGVTQAGAQAGVTGGASAQAGSQAGGVAGASSAGARPPVSCDEGSPCGVSCVDLDSDPNNCGGCGRTCVIPNASARCASGQCQVASCEPGYLDQDGALDNGCELESDCVEGAGCLTSCGSDGVERCEEGVTSCEAPQETCNLIDDDCDGSCDEGWQALGCRTPIHRGYGNGYHIYSSDLTVVSQNGTVESQSYFYLSNVEVPNSRPVFFCRSAMNKPFLSSLTDCGVPRAPEGVLGFWLSAPACGATPLYHLVTPNEGDFFYTISAGERDHAVSLGFQDRGVAGYVWLP